MSRMKDKKKIKFCDNLDNIQSAMNGIASLLERQNTEKPFSEEELFGIGQCLKILANKVSKIEDKLRSELN